MKLPRGLNPRKRLRDLQDEIQQVLEMSAGHIHEIGRTFRAGNLEDSRDSAVSLEKGLAIAIQFLEGEAYQHEVVLGQFPGLEAMGDRDASALLHVVRHFSRDPDYKAARSAVLQACEDSVVSWFIGEVAKEALMTLPAHGLGPVTIPPETISVLSARAAPFAAYLRQLQLVLALIRAPSHALHGW